MPAKRSGTDGPAADLPGAPPVRAVVFDFGGVLITPITTGVARLAERHAIDPTTMLTVLLGPHDSGDHPWHRAERGEIPVADIQPELAPFAAAVGIELIGDEIDVLLEGGYEYDEAVLGRITALRDEGIATALLTNTFAEFHTTLASELDLAMFDAVVESYAVGARKPEPAIYHATAEMLGVDHTEIAYLDDFAQNLAPAAALGWRTVHVTDRRRALVELDGLLER